MSYMNPNLPEPLPGESPEGAMEPGSATQLSQEEAGYRPAASGDQSCSNCAHFIRNAQQALGMGICEVVSGQVSPNGVSDMFTPADQPEAPQGGLQSLL